MICQRQALCCVGTVKVTLSLTRNLRIEKKSIHIRNLSSLPAHRTLDVLNEAIRLDHEEREMDVANMRRPDDATGSVEVNMV